MTYIASSLTSANPAADLYTAMATALSTAGFTLVDTVVISTRTHKVWKSAAGSNAQGLDWYLDVAYTTTGNGSVWLGAFEDYNATTHVGTRGPYNNGNDTNNPESTFYSRFGATTSALETSWTHISNNVSQIQVQTSAFAYWISITTDRVIAMTSVAPTSVMYCGFFEMYTPWANKIGALAYPLVSCTVNSPNSRTGAQWDVAGGHSVSVNLLTPPTLPSFATPVALTRRPPVALTNGNSSAGWNAGRTYIASNDGSATNADTGANYASPIGYVDVATPSAYFDSARGARIALNATWVNSNASDGSNVCIGLLSDIAVFAGSAVTRGDTITISSATWVLGAIATNRCYGFKAA